MIYELQIINVQAFTCSSNNIDDVNSLIWALPFLNTVYMNILSCPS